MKRKVGFCPDCEEHRIVSSDHDLFGTVIVIATVPFAWAFGVVEGCLSPRLWPYVVAWVLVTWVYSSWRAMPRCSCGLRLTDVRACKGDEHVRD